MTRFDARVTRRAGQRVNRLRMYLLLYSSHVQAPDTLVDTDFSSFNQNCKLLPKYCLF
jgi:hypothetical protein